MYLRLVPFRSSQTELSYQHRKYRLIVVGCPFVCSSNPVAATDNIKIETKRIQETNSLEITFRLQPIQTTPKSQNKMFPRNHPKRITWGRGCLKKIFIKDKKQFFKKIKYKCPLFLHFSSGGDKLNVTYFIYLYFIIYLFHFYLKQNKLFTKTTGFLVFWMSLLENDTIFYFVFITKAARIQCQYFQITSNLTIKRFKEETCDKICFSFAYSEY